MVDELWDRQYQDGRNQLHSGLDRAIGRIVQSTGTTFQAMKAIQFDAPWAARSKDAGCA